MPNNEDPPNPSPVVTIVDWLARTQSNALRALIRRRLGNDSDAQDIAQEVYARLLKMAPETRLQNPTAYMFGIANFVISDLFSDRARARVSYNGLPSDYAEHGALEVAQEHDPCDVVDAERREEAILATLPPRVHAVVLMKNRDGMTYDEIAEQLGVPRRTAERYYHRAMVALRSKLNEL
jgi:RNA polymerase sigma factor (sigma-70 family)